MPEAPCIRIGYKEFGMESGEINRKTKCDILAHFVSDRCPEGGI